MSRATALLGALALSVILSGCGGGKLEMPTPSGATDIGGPTMTSSPPTPPGWNPKDVVPQSQQQAQDTLLGYLRNTVKGLSPGITFDATRFGGVGSGNVGCDDNATAADASTRFNVAFDITVPPGTDNEALIQAVGDVWRSWGWYVYERDGFRKPNLFGFSPDGYVLRIVSAARAGFPPGLEGSTPCFPGNLARNDIAFPAVVTP
ncbi:hypothetical protein FEG63_11110 [Mycolicibacterium sphagni]|uniref:Uncharacterized protein n=2 Tax=Mycolicibacterium sphagni TaxID=1786 RepID=A0ABX2JTG1_9MYCO|nr:hypothetical protein [Mycolicibacterium sphagni]